MRLAVIENGIVTNVIEGDFQNARHIFPLESQVVNVDFFPVSIGDTYESGKFYRDGEVIPRTLTADEKIGKLEMDKALLQQQMDELTILVLQQGGVLVG